MKTQYHLWKIDLKISIKKKVDDLIWVLEHDHIYTSGTSYNENEIIDKSINIIKTDFYSNFLSFQY